MVTEINYLPEVAGIEITGCDVTITEGNIIANGAGGGGGNFVGGEQAGDALTTGFGDVLIGYKAGNLLTDDHENTFVGYKSGEAALAVENATGVGAWTLQDADGAHRSVAIGKFAGSAATGVDCLYLGYQAGQYNTDDDKLFIENDNHLLIEGDFANQWTTVHGDLNIDGVSYFDGTLGDKINFMEGRVDAFNNYAIGYEGVCVYQKSTAYHRWYIATEADEGVSDVMELSPSYLQVNTNAAITGNVGIGTNDPKGKLHINGTEVHKHQEHNTSTDALDVSNSRIIELDATAGNIVIGGLSGGVNGQRITLMKAITVNSVTIEHYEATGDEKITCPNATDVVWANGTTGGMELVCYGPVDSEIWHVVSMT